MPSAAAEALRTRAERAHHKHLVRLKLAITYGSTMDWGTQDATLLVQSVLRLGTEALDYHCEPGYHDELVAWHLGCVQDTSTCKGMPELGRRLPWERKRWVWRERVNLGERLTTSVLAPRGTGKTVWSSVLAVWYGIRYRNARILITSKTDRAAGRLGLAIRRMLEYNPMLLAMFGSLKGDTWDAMGFNIRGRTRTEGAPTFSVIGSGGQVASAHFEVIFADDVCTTENSRTEGARDKLADWYYSTLEPTCRPTNDVEGLGCGRIHGSGTRYHPRDLHYTLQHDSADYREGYQRYPALRPSVAWRKRHQAELRAWAGKVRRLRREGAKEEEYPEQPLPTGGDEHKAENWVALCEPFLSVQQLVHMMQNTPRSAFWAQYMVDAKALAGALFRADWIRWTHELPAMKRMLGATGMDMGIKAKEGSDYTALLHVKLDDKYEHPETGQRGRILVWDAVVKHLTLAAKVQAVLSDHKANRPSVVRVEKVAAQAMFLEQPQFAGLPVEGVTPATDKLARASHLLTWFEQGRIAFVERRGQRAQAIAEGMQQAVYQLLDFTGDGSTHDDAVDALGFAVDAVTSRWTRPVDQSKDPPQDEQSPLAMRSRAGFQPRGRKGGH